MENSKLTYQYWYMAFMLITGTKKSFSALEGIKDRWDTRIITSLYGL